MGGGRGGWWLDAGTNQDAGLSARTAPRQVRKVAQIAEASLEGHLVEKLRVWLDTLRAQSGDLRSRWGRLEKPTLNPKP